jgi:hypothetical protein
MKVLLALIVLVAGGYYFYNRSVDAANPEAITDPVFAEIRVDAAIGGRELNMAMFGAMASDEDCRERAMRVWEKLLACPECKMKKAECKEQIDPRYERFFADSAIHSTYLSFTRGSRFERDGRMVIYGLTAGRGGVLIAGRDGAR